MNQAESGKIILLVEDEALLALSTAHSLQKHGYEVLIAAKGEQAVQIAQARADLSLVLMDINLGMGMDGVETAIQILRQRDLPLVFLSSHTEQAIVEKTEQITSYGYIVKNSGETVLLASLKMAFRLFEARQQQKEKERALAQRESILSAVANAAGGFLQAADWRLEMNAFLALIGSSAAVSRVYLFEVRPGKADEVLASQLFEWCEPGIDPQIDNSELQNQPLRASGFGVWVDMLARGELVHSVVRDFPAAAQSVLQSQNILSCVVAPIFVQGRWWGFLGFDECHFERNWAAGELDALKAASHVLEASISRAQIEQSLRRSQTRLQALFDHALDALLLLDDQAQVVDANPAAQGLFGLSRAELLQHNILQVAALNRPAAQTRLDQMWQAFLTSGAQQDRLSLPQSDGAQIWVDYRAVANIAPGLHLVVINDITARVQAEEAWAESLQEKQRLLAELQHRAKNSFAMLVGLISLMEENANQQARAALGEIAERVQALAKLYDLLYTSGNVEQTNLAQYLQQVLDSLVGLTSQVQLQTSLEPLFLPVRQAAPLGLIVTELVTNSLKHAFPDGRAGLLQVALASTTGGACLTLADNGVGLPPDDAWSDSASTGMTVVRLLTSQIGGTLHYESCAGVCWRLDFPLAV